MNNAEKFFFSQFQNFVKRRFLDDDDDHHDDDDHDDNHDEDHDEDHHDEDHHDEVHDEHEVEHNDEEGVNVETFKIIMMVCMFLCIGFGLLPKVCKVCRESKEALSMMNCFSAGLFLGMALVHMMPEAAEIYTGWAVTEGIERAFPLPYVTFFLGYVMILAIDRVIAHRYKTMEEKPQAINADADGPIELPNIAPTAGSDD